MEGHESLLVLVLVLCCVSCGHSDRIERSGALGCSFNERICQHDEYCFRDTYPPGKCKKIEYRNQVENDDLSDITYEDFKNFHPNREYNDQRRTNQNSEYDMTYFENRDSEDEPTFMDHVADRNQESRRRNNVHKGFNTARNEHFDESNNERYNHVESFENFEHVKTLKRDENVDEEWFPMEIPIEKRITHGKRTAESEMIHNENENSLDLDVEIKPLSISDDKHFDKEKVKLSSIPEKPVAEKSTLQEIEHVQTNIVDTKPSKKAKVGMLIGGKLNEAKASIVHENSPDKTYRNVKDFFKSQQVSSIVDAPLAEKKDGINFYSLKEDDSSEEKDVNVKRNTTPKPAFVYPRGIRLHMKERLNSDKADHVVDSLQDLLWGPNVVDKSAFTSVHVEDKAVSFHMINNTTTSGQGPSSIVERINRDQSLKRALHKATGVHVVSASLKLEQPQQDSKDEGDFMITTLIVAGCVTGVLLASVCIFIILRRNQYNRKWILKPAGHEAASDYQSLWRQLRQATWDAPVHTPPVSHSDSSDPKVYFGNKGLPAKYSWSEEPVDTKMDISTGHAVLAYMEDHLKNENRLSKEWEDLNVYEAEPNETRVGKDPKNSKKNRYSDVLPYDHNRVKLRETSNATGSDYINASYIIDDDPRNPAYIATQGPLSSTIADFWQMIWEQGVVVVVMLTKLADLGLPQCHRYWPEKGNETYHIYQVHLISEHIWCSDFLVRSFYLKNIQTDETRTVTQFHFLTWPHLGIPISSKPLLDFRRKVIKCFRSQASPVVVHCSGGIDRTGTYILIDMVLGKMSKGTKEIDIAATLEHLRDQRPDMVKTKVQFEFALTSVAEEVNAILQVLTKH